METGARRLLGFILFHFFVNKVYDSHKLCEQSFGLKEKKKKTREKKLFENKILVQKWNGFQKSVETVAQKSELDLSNSLEISSLWATNFDFSISLHFGFKKRKVTQRHNS